MTDVVRAFDERVRRASKEGLLVGMACTFAFVVQVFFAPAMTHVTPFMVSFTDLSYLCGAAFAAFLLARVRASGRCRFVPMLWTVAAAVAILFAAYGAMVPDVASVASAAPPVNVLFLLGGALFGAYLALAIPLWLRVCSAYDPGDIVWTILLAGTLGSVLVWFLGDMGSARLVAASEVMLLLGTSMLGRLLADAEGGGAEALRAPRPLRTQGVSARLFAAGFLIAFAFTMAISFAEADGASSSYAAGTFFAPVIVACACLLVLRGFTASLLLNMAVPLIAGVVMAASFFGIEPVLSFDLAVAGVFLFLVYAAMTVLFATYGDEESSYRAFLAFAACFAGGCVAGRIGSALAVVDEPVSSHAAVLVSIFSVMAALLLCVRAASLPGRSSESEAAVSAEASPSSALVIERRIAREAERAGLGRREKEALSLLLAGKSAPEIAEAMVVAPGTAKSHVCHVYRKLGVHSRAELFEAFGLDSTHGAGA